MYGSVLLYAALVWIQIFWVDKKEGKKKVKEEGRLGKPRGVMGEGEMKDWC